MNIIVCVKHVPDTAEAEVTIDESGKDIKKDRLPFDINEWDNYALEEALLIKEKYGGKVTAITVGPKEAEETLRKCLAKGADEAVRLYDETFKGSDGYVTAKILHSFIKNLQYDLILTGVQAADDEYAQVGVTLAEMLGIQHVSMVKKVEILEGAVRVNRELEGGLEETVEVKLPAVLTIQTGINEPRYVSIAGIRRASKKEIKVVGLDQLGLRSDEVGEQASPTIINRLFMPEVEKKVEILAGSPGEVSTQLLNILKEKGVLSL
ncbi:electron transfer flavoprotein subunit beta [Candidatus Bathyarchaeota archaeon]|nr:MAG: electron transfer flavoprotein subunit beta [Candidatus Bathyarchaeota archaeon]